MKSSAPRMGVVTSANMNWCVTWWDLEKCIVILVFPHVLIDVPFAAESGMPVGRSRLMFAGVGKTETSAPVSTRNRLWVRTSCTYCVVFCGVPAAKTSTDNRQSRFPDLGRRGSLLGGLVQMLQDGCIQEGT